ncbi:hypothetical protein B5P43_18285 [Bacillus sp. SRB_336]|nr:hypothetical protein B5P43_18285 [Bacillus sp. SRB_336]
MLWWARKMWLVMDQELFELCKEVYERTGWNEMKFFHSKYGLLYITQLPSITDGDDEFTPSYTSDYLLEKLPEIVTTRGSSDFLHLKKSHGEYHAYYSFKRRNPTSDTPLKALLKLVIALDDAGELIQ